MNTFPLEMLMAIFLRVCIILIIRVCGVYSNGEKYNLETYNIMQILKPVGAVIKNGSIVKSPVS
jgi:hypothetical protein